MTDADLIVLPGAMVVGMPGGAARRGRFWSTATHLFLASIADGVAIVSVSRRDAGPITERDRVVLRTVVAPLNWQEEPADVAADARRTAIKHGVEPVPNYKLMCELEPAVS